MRKIFIIFISIILAYTILVMSLGLLYMVVTPVSTLMLARLATFHGFEYESVNIQDVSPQLLRSVIRAEDAKFCQHSGIDWDSMEKAIEDKDGKSRGASTIPMQVTKNLFLWPQQSYVRKAIELPIAMYLDAIWSKARMMEVYLTIAQWGDGVFGIESASQKYYGKSAKQLNSYEASMLAAMLPNPIKRNPLKPSRYHVSYASNIEKWANSDVDLSCIRKGRIKNQEN